MTALERLTAVAVAGTVALTGCAAGQSPGRAAAKARPRILVVTAVDYEQAAVRAVLRAPEDGMIGGRAFTVGQIDGAEVVALRGGWGKAHAAGATALGIERFHPDLVVMAGISGGLDPERATSGDVVVGADTFQHDLGLRKPDGDLELWPAQTPLEQPYPGPRFTSPPALVAAAAAAARQAAFTPWMLPAGCACENDGRRKPSCTGAERRVDRAEPRVVVGTLATGDVFLADRRLALALASRERAVSVDMETAAVAQEAADHGLPFLGVRLVSDVVGGPDGDALYYCLKPQSGPRLTALMQKILPAVAGGAR